MSEYTFKLPDLGEGLVEAEISEWMVKPGDPVEDGQVFCSMLTDKAAVELSAPVDGVVVSVAGEVGDTIAVGSMLIIFETDADREVSTEKVDSLPEEVTQSNEEPVVPVQANTDVQANRSGQAKIATSPSIRQRAKDAGIDLDEVSGSGPRGRILKTDFESFQQGNTTNRSTETSKPNPTDVTEIKVVGLRRIIAERMGHANREIPHFAYVEEVDVTELESLRQHLNASQNDRAQRLTMLPMLGLALVRALAQHPSCNAWYNSEKNVIQRFNAVHLGIATQTTDGLKVPVVKHSESLGLYDLATEIKRVAAAARDNSATREELGGSTITVTSLGKTGGIVTTPIINAPEVAIIGVGKAIERPMVVNGQVVVRRMMNLSSSFDHRFVDGYDAAEMIQAVKGLLEHPATIFMES